MTASAGTTAEAVLVVLVALVETTAEEDAEMITTGRVIDLEIGKATEEETEQKIEKRQTDRAAGQMIAIGATIARTGITGEAEEKAEAETITHQVTIDTGATVDEVDLRAIDHAAEVL